MATRKGIERDLTIKCSLCPTTTTLTTSNLTTSYKGLDLGTEADKVFGKNFQSFGTCSKLNGPCVAKIDKWIGLSDAAITCNGHRLLNDKSQMICTVGPALIDIITDPPPASVDQLNAIKQLQNKMNGAVNKVNPLKKVSDQANKAKEGLFGKVSGWFGGVKKSTTDALGAATDAVSDTIDGAKEYVSDGIETVGDTASELADDFVDLHKEAFDLVSDNLDVIGEGVKDFMSEAHIAIGDGIGGAVDWTKDQQNAFVSFAESKGYGNAAQAWVDLGTNAAEIPYYFLEAASDTTHAIKDGVVAGASRVGDYIDDSSKILDDLNAGADFVLVNGKKIGVGVYRRSALNALMNTEDYKQALSEDKDSAEKMLTGVKDWFSTANASDYRKLIGKGGWEVLLMAASGGMGGVGVKAVQAKKALGTANQSLDAMSSATTAGKAATAKPGQGHLLMNGPEHKQKLVKVNDPDAKGNPNQTGPGQNGNSSNGDKDDNTGISCNPKSCSDPVDAITGIMFYKSDDFTIPGIIPIIWKRSWYSDSKYLGPIGYGFHHSYDMHIVKEGNNLITTLKDGRSAFFPLLSKNDNIHYNRQEKLTLSMRDNEVYELFDHSEQLTYTFKKIAYKFRLVKIFNANNVSIHLEYINATLFKIIDTANRVITIQSNRENYISQINVHHEGVSQKLVSYSYNDAGDLIKIYDNLNKPLRMVYKNHLMVSQTDRNGKTFYWEYDGVTSGSKCIHTWGEGGILDYKFEYGDDFNRVTDSLGHTTHYFHKGNIASKVIDPLGGEFISHYNDFQELEYIINEEGEKTSYIYDSKGNLSTVVLPDSSEIEYTYDAKGRLTVLTRPEGGTLIRSYKNGKLDCIISPDEEMTTFEYNEKGLVTKVFNNQESETQLCYNQNYDIIKIIYPNQTVALWEYNSLGKCLNSTNPQNIKQVFQYDVNGRISHIKSPDGNTVKFKYDAYEGVTEVIDKHRALKFEYTPLGNLKTREENGSKVHFQYNREEQLIGIINEHKESYTFKRDPKGNIINEERFDGITQNYQRDKAGKVLKVDRPGNKHSIYEYDKVGRVSRVEHHDGSWAVYNYNKDGLLIEALNPNSHIKFKRDSAGRVLMENQDGYTISSEYGEVGLRTKIKSSLGADLSFDYSKIGEVTRTIAKTKGGTPWEANFLYNSLGMEIERALPGNVVSSWKYNIAGNPQQHIVKINQQNHRNKSHDWDVNVKLKKITDHLSLQSINFNYDDFNNLASAQYEDGSYDYKLPDEVGNLYRNKNDQEYGKSGKLLRSGDITYNYDEEGNLIEKKTLEGTWNYFWEAEGMLQSVIKPGKTRIDFEYDALGRRTAKIVSTSNIPNSSSPIQGYITRWIWNGSTPLHEWQYDLNDRPASIVNESGSISQNKKEPVKNLITWIFDQGSFRPAGKITKDETYSIITDHLGTPVEMYNAKGEKTWEVAYDIYGKVRKLKMGKIDDCPFRYQGQYEDVETGLYYNRFRYYAPNEGMYISQDPIGLSGDMPNMYAYVPDANNSVDPLGLAIWHDQGIPFKDWFDQASPKEIVANIDDVVRPSGLRFGGGKHELFPVSMAVKAKELGFTASELEKMSIETEKILFTGVRDNKTGEILPDGKHHSSQASSHFHTKLMEDLEVAQTKAEAEKIIDKHHGKHMIICPKK